MARNKNAEIQQTAGKRNRIAGYMADLAADLTPRGWLLLALSAAMLVLAFPSAGWFPLVYVALVPLLWVLFESKSEHAFAVGFLTQFAAKLGTLYWLVYTMNYYGNIHPVPAVIILLLMVAFLASFNGLACVMIVRLGRDRGMPLALAAPAAWLAAEWIQGWILTGFPWAFLGYAPYRWLTAVQAADLLGVWGLSALVVLVNVAVFEALRFALGKRRTFPRVVVPVVLALFVGSLVYGVLRVGQVEKAMEQAPRIKVAVTQGNIRQDQKWSREYRIKTLRIYDDLIGQAVDEGAELVLLPETAIPIWVYRDRGLRKSIRQLAETNGVHVLVGCPSRNTSGEEQEKKNYNSAVLLSPKGEALGWYDKNHLVPFGEYIPFKKILQKLLGPLVQGTGNFRSSGRINLLSYPRSGFGVIICYEAIFPSLTRRIVNRGAGFLANITNDAWFGKTSAPHQHLMMVALRAIENRVYIPRAANTGISGIVDPTGRILYQTPLYERALYVGEIGIMNQWSLYRSVGDVLVYAALIALAAMGIAARVRRKKDAPSGAKR